MEIKKQLIDGAWYVLVVRDDGQVTITIGVTSEKAADTLIGDLWGTTIEITLECAM